MSRTDDVRALFDHAWGRLRHGLIGLGDDEWCWQPTADPENSLQSRLQALCYLLRDNGNARRVGRAPTAVQPRQARDAADAVAQLEAAYADWRGHLVALSLHDLASPVGPIGADDGDSTRLAFVLHLAEEFIHHGAQIGLLRELYAARVTEHAEGR